MEQNVVNFLQPGKVVSIRFVGGICVAYVDFGAEVPVVLHPYHNEQVGDYIVMNGKGKFVRHAPPASTISQ